MRSRGFNKRIEIWQTAAVADGFGGRQVTSALLSSSWAKIKTLDLNKSTLTSEFGVLDSSNSIEITMRKRNDLDYNTQTMFIMYRSEKYIIKSFPININFEDSYIRIICTKEANR